MRKINTIEIGQANKVMHMAAIAYNLKKYLKFTQKLTKSEARTLGILYNEIKELRNVLNLFQSRSEFNQTGKFTK